MKTENKIAPKINFQSEIEKYYSEISKGQIPIEILNAIVRIITDKIYTDYKRWWKQYPKSRKRYSKLKLDDLEHDFVYSEITEYLKELVPNEYRKYSKVLLKVDDTEFDKFLKRKSCYENK